MIDERATFKKYGYHSYNLSKQSHKKVVRICDVCGKVRDVRFDNYRGICHLCASRAAERRQKISSALSGRPFSDTHRKKLSKSQSNRSKETRLKMSAAQKGKHPSEATRRKLSESRKNPSKETRRKISESQKGAKNCNYRKHPPKQTRRKISATMQGIPYDKWETFAKEQKYCPKFNEACKESNREKYGRRCFICGKTEKENRQRLSVHHVDMNKAQGCDSNWKLVPLCTSCHSRAHNSEIVARLGYLLK